MIFRELGKFQAFLTRNTDTIKNTHVRKLTSIALMAIMVGGGLTFAIPGMEPAYAAQISSNPNLKVSAEGQNAGNTIASTNIVEVVVIDDLTDTDQKKPIVRVDGTILDMYFFNNGWYGYFANDDIKGTGVATIADGDTEATDTQINNLVKNNPGRVNGADGEATAGQLGGTDPVRPGVALLDLDGEFDIVYARAGGDQTVTLDLDDPDSGISLDRTTYPQNTGVVITIDDQALNVDPTSTDKWTFVSNGKQFFGTPTTDTVTPLTTAVSDRDGKISDAQGTYDDAIRDNPEPDPGKAREGLDAKSEAADEIINNPLNALDDENRLGPGATVDVPALTELIRNYGQGAKDVTDRTVTNADDTVDGCYYRHPYRTDSSMITSGVSYG